MFGRLRADLEAHARSDEQELRDRIGELNAERRAATIKGAGVTKAHGGSIAVDSKIGEYSEFTITLPRKP